MDGEYFAAVRNANPNGREKTNCIERPKAIRQIKLEASAGPSRRLLAVEIPSAESAWRAMQARSWQRRLVATCSGIAFRESLRLQALIRSVKNSRKACFRLLRSSLENGGGRRRRGWSRRRMGSDYRRPEAHGIGVGLQRQRAGAVPGNGVGSHTNGARWRLGLESRPRRFDSASL